MRYFKSRPIEPTLSIRLLSLSTTALNKHLNEQLSQGVTLSEQLPHMMQWNTMHVSIFPWSATHDCCWNTDSAKPRPIDNACDQHTLLRLAPRNRQCERGCPAREHVWIYVYQCKWQSTCSKSPRLSQATHFRPVVKIVHCSSSSQSLNEFQQWEWQSGRPESARLPHTTTCTT